jgi:hypothetical protein
MSPLFQAKDMKIARWRHGEQPTVALQYSYVSAVMTQIKSCPLKLEARW